MRSGCAACLRVPKDRSASHVQSLARVKMISMIWKSLLRSANVISALLLAWMHSRGSSRKRSAKDVGDGRVEFSPDLLTYFAWPLIVLLPAWPAINELRRGSAEWWQLMTPIVLLFLAASEMFTFPGTIVVSHDAIEQHFWLRGEKRIRWGEITEIREPGMSGALTITASDKTKIIFSNRLSDRPRFLAEIENHCRGNLPPEFLNRLAAGSRAGQKSG